jgi:SsrA-binding protein
MDIPLYAKSSIDVIENHENKWPRKLLMTKRQISRLAWKTTKTWLVIIPLYIYENKKRLIKLFIWVWKLRRKIEKKQIIKNRDIKREMDRDIRSYR